MALDASQMRYIAEMNLRPIKSSSLPSVRVEPQLREAVESVLEEGESLSEFVEDSVRQALARRSHQAEFVRRGLASLEAARQGADLVDADAVLVKLQRRLASAQAQAGKAGETGGSAGSSKRSQIGRSARR